MNTVHVVGSSHRTYINGSQKLSISSPGGNFYDKFGSYRTDSGRGPVTEPDGRYTILDFAGTAQRLFKHPDLMPKTPFYDRVTPVLGPASSPVEIQLPAATTFRSTAENTTPNAPPTSPSSR